MGNQLDNSSRAPNNTPMGTVVHSELEGAQFGLCYTPLTLRSTLLETNLSEVCWNS
jgi:hypothetical protein